MSQDDLIPLQISKTLIPTQVSNIEDSLNIISQEWREMLLEQHELKQMLDKTRKQLAHAIYSNDAATRVIA